MPETPSGSSDPPSSRRLPIVGVMGSGTFEHDDIAGPLGGWLAGLPVHLLTGGGPGVMTAVSRAFSAVAGRRGAVIGVIPGAATEAGYAPKAGYPNPFVEIPVFTHLPLSGDQGCEPLSRNHINVLSADLIIALPGGAGTLSEATLALRYGKPLVALLPTGTDLPGLPADVPRARSLPAVQAFVVQYLSDLPERSTE